MDFLSLFKNTDLQTTVGHVLKYMAIVLLVFLAKFALVILLDIIVGFRVHFFSKLWPKNFVRRYGRWAVVTGCTDGIGKYYAEELAKEGLNILLISRTMDKLEKVSSELVRKYKVETEMVQVDFSNGRQIYQKISKHLEKKDIGILVNNVGVILPHPKYFINVTEDDIWNHVNVNMGAVCSMTRLVMPQMVAKGKGAIVNLSSVAGRIPTPLLGIYSASKAFVDNFSQALEWECKGKGITVQTVTPSYVATNMTSYSSWIGTENFMTPSPSTFAWHAVSTIGYTKRTTGYWPHGFQVWICDNIPRGIMIHLTGRLQKFFLKSHTT